MYTLLQDVRYGIRMLAKNPGFAAVAVLSLALGIGANTTIFSIVDKELLNPWPVKDPGRLAMISTDSPQPDQAAAEGRALVVSYNLWQKYFRGDPSLPGKTTLLDDKQFTVIGVAPQEFPGLRWVRPELCRQHLGRDGGSSRGVLFPGAAGDPGGSDDRT